MKHPIPRLRPHSYHLCTSFLIFIMLGSMHGISQSLNTLTAKIASPSPEASTLGKYGEYPVTLNNGLVNISIPIYEIKTNKQSLPIGISYHSGGIKVNDIASSVGLGWALNAGGVVTRVINGIPDETQQGWLTSMPVSDSDAGEHMRCYIGKLALGNPSAPADGQADVFYYNFNGIHGKFLFKKPITPGAPPEVVTIPVSPIKIKVDFYGAIEILAQDGTKYIFAQTETSRATNSDGLIYNVRTAWYLTQVTSPDQSDQINLSYTSPVLIPSITASNTLTEITSPATRSLTSRVSTSRSLTDWLHYSVNVSEISFKNGKVVFEYVSDRQDITAGRRLDKIGIYQYANGVYKQLKRFVFNQSYFTAAGGQNSLLSNLQSESEKKRLRLDSFYEEGTLQSLYLRKPPHVFTYEEGAFPQVNSTAQDFMGYYNGAHTNKDLLYYGLSQDVYGWTLSQQNGANRSVNTNTIKAGMLKRITYPTAGYTDFLFEPNQANYTSVETRPIYQNYNYPLTSRDLSKLSETITITNEMTGNEPSIIAQFGVSVVNNITGEQKISTTVSVFDLTTNKYADIITDVFGGGGQGATFAVPASTTTMQGLKEVILVNGHIYKFSYAEPNSIPTTQNFLYTTLTWRAETGQTTDVTVNHTDYTGGLRINSITSYDGQGKTIKRSYKYPGWYRNSNLYSGDIATMAQTLTRVARRNILDVATAQSRDEVFKLYGEGFSFPLGSTSNNAISYSEVEEYSLDGENTPLGKSVYTYQQAVDAIPSILPLYRTDEEWKREQLLKQSIYKYTPEGQGSYLLQREIHHEYDNTFLFNITNVVASVDYHVEIIECWADGCPILLNFVQMWQECITVPKSLITKTIDINQSIYRSHLKKTTTIDYDEAGLTPLATTTNEFEYGNTHHLQITRSTQESSDENILTTNIKYPLDYNLTSCDLNQCYTTFNTSISNLLVQKKQCEIPTYEQYLTSGELSDFDIYKACATDYQNQVTQTVLPAFNNCVSSYNTCLTNTINTASDRDKAILIMQRDNWVNIPIENSVGLIKSGTEFITSADRIDHKMVGVSVMPNMFWLLDSKTKLNKASFDLSPSSYYRKAGTIIAYDASNNVLQRTKEKDVNSSYIWDYNNQYPVAEVINAGWDEIAYTSFEANGTGNWNIPSSVRSSEHRSGVQSYDLGEGAITKSLLATNKSYKVSFWIKDGATATLNGNTMNTLDVTSINGWRYVEKLIPPGPSSISLSGTGLIDELRIWPSDASMTTYTFNPGIGMTTVTDANNRSTFYEYDALGRVMLLRDHELNIIKKYSYQYKLD